MSMHNPSYHRREPLIVTDRMRRQIAGAVAEIDLEQVGRTRQLTPAQRVRQAASMIDAAERAGAYRLRLRQPELSEDEALRIVRSGLLAYELGKSTCKAETSAS